MPIAQIIVAPKAVEAVVACGQALVDQVTRDLLAHLQPAPHTIQVMVVPSLLEPQGCDLLCLVHHRGSASRSAAVRAAAAAALHDTLRGATGCSVRVRLIALDPENIAAKDTEEEEG